MTEELPSKSESGSDAHAAEPGIVHTWWEKTKKRTPFVIFLLFTGAIIWLGNFIISFEAVSSFVSKRFDPVSAQAPAQATKAQMLAQPSDEKWPPVEVQLADGKTAAISWSAEFEVAPQDAPMYAVEFDGMADVHQELAAAFKRDLLRRTTAIDSKKLPPFRVQLENELTEELRKEFGPRGVTVQSISLGELASE